MLEYQTAPKRYQPTEEDRQWRLRRLAYWGMQLLLFAAIVYRVGPNLILFHRPWSPGPADYVALTNDYIPMIAAIKAYSRDTGVLPMDSYELPPAYRPATFKHDDGEIAPWTSITFGDGRNVIEYEFASGKEGWIIHSPRYDGPIPAPIVMAAPKPTTHSASQPSATPTMNSTHGS